MKFLLIGAGSFYGWNFENYCLWNGDEVIKYPHRLGDTVDLSSINVDCVVNFASKSLVAESWEKPCEWTQTNVTDTTSFIQRLLKAKFKKYIHVSTPEVYGSTDDVWVREGHPFNPTTPYAVSRAAGDMMVMAYHKAYGLPAIITRTANIYGPGQQHHRLIPKAFSYKLLNRPFPLHGDGQSKRSFIYIRDACEATYLLCEKGEVGETYHISTQRSYQIRDVLPIIGVRFEHVEERLGKDRTYLLNTDKIRALGWRDKTPFERGIVEYEHYNNKDMNGFPPTTPAPTDGWEMDIGGAWVRKNEGS